MLGPVWTACVLAGVAAAIAVGYFIPKPSVPRQAAPVMYCALSDESFAPCARFVGIEKT